MQLYGPLELNWADYGNSSWVMTKQHVLPVLFSDLLFRAILSWQGQEYKRPLQTGMSLQLEEERRARPCVEK